MAGARLAHYGYVLLLSLLILPGCQVIEVLSTAFMESGCTAFPDAQRASIYSNPYGYYPMQMEIVGSAAPGERIVLIGREEGGWYQVEEPAGWLWAGDGWRLSGPCGTLPRLDEGEFIQPLPDPNLCYYAQYGEGSPFSAYSDPRLGVPERIVMLENRVYQAVRRTERWYEIVLDGEQTGWVRSGTGSLVAHCDDIPYERLRPVPPEGVCTIYMDAINEFDTSLYDRPDVENGAIVGAAPEEAYIVVEARRSNGEGLRVRLDDGVTGWLMTPWQALAVAAAFSGPCDDVPYEEVDFPGG